MRKYRELSKRVNKTFDNMEKNVKGVKSILDEMKESNESYSQKIEQMKRGE